MDGEGGKKVLANNVAFPSLLSVGMVLPEELVLFSEGILGRPPSPEGLFRNLLAVHMSADESSFRKFS